MKAAWRYIAATSLGLLASFVVVALGFTLATESFVSAGYRVAERDFSRTQSKAGALVPTSALLGRSPEEVASTAVDNQRKREGEWVEVTDAVNMRSGGSSSNPVLKVQLEGKRLRVASREGGWIEVIEPETELSGWVYGQFVKPIEPESRQAGVVAAEP